MREQGRQGSHVVRTVVIVALLAVVGVGAALGVSVMRSISRIRVLLEDAVASYEQATAYVDENNLDAALYYARQAADDMVAVDDELQGTQWEVASHLPYLGQDAAIAREMGSIAGSLAADAVTPALDRWDELMADGLVTESGIDLSKVPEKLQQVQDLVDAVNHATEVVHDCDQLAQGLPQSHFDELNQAEGALREAIGAAEETLDGLGDAMSLLDALSSGLLSLMGA